MNYAERVCIMLPVTNMGSFDFVNSCSPVMLNLYLRVFLVLKAAFQRELHCG